MTTWTLREDIGDANERIAAGKQILEAFGRWSVPETETMIAFASRADASGGCAITETDDVFAIADAAARFEAWYSWDIVPAMDLQDGKTIEFLLNSSTFNGWTTVALRASRVDMSPGLPSGGHSRSDQGRQRASHRPGSETPAECLVT